MDTPHASHPPLRVFVTGGTSGLGLALVEAFAARGDAVAFVARHGDAVARVARRVAGSHGIVGDVARKDDVHPIALQVGAALGGLDVLVHNASSLGPVPLALLADTECEDFEAALAANVVGPFRVTKALLGLLAGAAREGARSGRRSVVLAVSSDAAATPYAGWGAYGASKAALAHLSRIWDEELRPHGIAVVAVDPGDMDTPLHALAVPDADPATLKRPADAARQIVARIDRERRGGAAHAGIARHGRPVQYAHLAEPLALWDVWTRIAGPPVAFEPPSAGFVIDWRLLDALRARDVGFATLTHAAGLSSTGDPALDARLPFDEPYRVPAATVAAIGAARRIGGRIVAIGTTVARALEHAATRPGGLSAGTGIATNRLGPASELRVADVLVSGTHEAGTSHHELLRAFVSEATLARIDAALEAGAFRTHEFGDSVWIARERAQAPRWNLKTATLASRFGQVRTTLPA